MRIATWNVNGLRARLDFVRHWLEARRPDVVGLQELKLADEAFPHDALAEAGYTAVVHGQKSWNGVAVLARERPVEVVRGLPGQDGFGSRLLTADVGDVRVTVVYCPNGKSVEHADYPRKLAWFDALAAHVRESGDAERPYVLLGDFNIVPDARDSWDEARLAGSIFHTDDERTRLRALFDLGLRDEWRERHGDERAFSWWDYRGGAFHRNLGLRIDLLLCSPALAGRVTGVEIDRDYRKKKDGMTASDHAPVMLDLA